jgi:hypothetical protein
MGIIVIILALWPTDSKSMLRLDPACSPPSAQADGQRPVGIRTARAEGPVVSGDEVHLGGRGFAAAAFEALQDFHEGSVAVP